MDAVGTELVGLMISALVILESIVLLHGLSQIALEERAQRNYFTLYSYIFSLMLILIFLVTQPGLDILTMLTTRTQ